MTQEHFIFAVAFSILIIGIIMVLSSIINQYYITPNRICKEHGFHKVTDKHFTPLGSNAFECDNSKIFRWNCKQVMVSDKWGGKTIKECNWE